MTNSVYILGALTCFACAFLLFRAYRRSATRLLLWSSICFAWLTVNHVMLAINVIVISETSYSIWRSLAALAGVASLLYGLIAESA